MRSASSQTDCGGYHVIGTPGPYVQRDCFSDAATGALVGGWYWSDDAPSCAAGVGHDVCAAVTYSPLCD